jgi:hypothetical protein
MPTGEAKAEKNLVYRHDSPTNQSRQDPLSPHLLSVSTVGRGHPSLVSLGKIDHIVFKYLSETCCRKGLGRGGVTPFVFPNRSVDIHLKTT